MALKSKIGLMAASIALLSVGLGANVFAIEFDGSGLSEDGTFHVNMAPPENEVEQYVLNEEITSLTRGGWGITAMGEWNCKDILLNANWYVMGRSGRMNITRLSIYTMPRRMS